MSRFARLSIVLVAVGCLGWAVWGLANEPVQSSINANPTTSSVEAVDSDSLAARYHYRNRTKRFFDRAKGRGIRRQNEVEPAEEVQIAARYHLRNRTEKFFDRAKDVKVAARYHLRNRTEKFFDRAKDVKVAARYHLRGRTASFFGRTIV
ncbi:MAG: hypothetical protein V3R99_05990 [Thermoguttaceae bacterium]